MHIETPARAPHVATPIGSDELIEGLMLVRASTLKMIRLQLAMERQDRRVALEAVDDLVALDGRLRDYLADVAATDQQFLFRHEVDAERAKLNHEKLTLAAEVLRKPAAPPVEEPQPGADDWLGPRDLPSMEERPRRGHWRLAAAAVVASALAAGAWLAGLAEMQSWLAAAAEAFR
jgi:hypothetical protein